MATRVPSRPVAVLLLMAVATACGGSSTPSDPGAAGGPTLSAAPGAPSTVATTAPALTGEEAVLAYGLAPTRDPSITYQPDVVLVGGGSSAIRWATDDALTWAIDRSAPGAADLAEGKVMFASSVAVGRVAQIEDQGDVRLVTLAPIGLTELIRDADLHLDQDLDLAAAAYHQLPADMPTEVPDASPNASASPEANLGGPAGAIGMALPTVRLAAYAPVQPPTRVQTAADRLTFPTRTCPEVGIGDWSVEPCIDPTGVTLTVDRKLDQHLKLGVVLKLPITKLHLRTGTLVRDGKLVESSGVLEGIKGIDISLSGGVGNGAQDNAKVKLEIPLEIETASIVVGGIPLKMLIEAKFTVDTAFSGKNSTLTAHGSYALDGPLGIEDGKPLVPILTVREGILDSMGGITVGVSGFVFGAKFKYQGGIGLYGFVVGPYATITISVGIGQGSVIGAPLAQCKGATLGVWVGAGAGYTVNASKLQWLLGKNSALSKYTAKLEEDFVQYQVIDRRALKPDSPICRG
jgi:hypothetical protein